MLNEKKSGRDLGQEIKKKNTGGIFLLEEQKENFEAAVTKWEMLAATNSRWKWAAVEKKVNENEYDISSKISKRVTKTFLEFSRCSRAEQRQRNVYFRFAW